MKSGESEQLEPDARLLERAAEVESIKIEVGGDVSFLELVCSVKENVK